MTPTASQKTRVFNKLWPFFCFYGGKWRAAPRYPKPQYRTVIEPFAGAAGYATRYADRDVILVERDPVIASLWRWLIAATPNDILSLPGVIDTTVDVLDIPKDAKSLIGFWCNKATTAPCLSPSKWMFVNVFPSRCNRLDIGR